MIQAKIIADSINEFGNRITTMIVTFPRIILSEFNTHRMFSRNTSSSRAVPFEKMLKSIEENPFVPIAWQKDHKGMQGTEYFTDVEVEKLGLISDWHNDKDAAIAKAKKRASKGVTKQICNRDLEEYMWTTVIVTATEYENFFALRCPKYGIKYINKPNEFPVTESTEFFRSKKDLLKDLDRFPTVQEAVSKRTSLEWLQGNEGQAEIHMMALAEAMWDVYSESTPKELKAGEWHIPFIEQISEKEIHELKAEEYSKNVLLGSLMTSTKIRVATVMAARTSYTVVGEDQKPLTYAKMIQIHDGLINASPKHMSPFEHCARTMTDLEYASHHNGVVKSAKEDDGEDAILNYEQYFNGQYGNRTKVDYYGWCKNFRGFIQYRALIPNENITK